MELEQAIAIIGQHFAKMDKIYRRPVFDEWAVVALSPMSERVLHYVGPRRETFGEELPGDLRMLRSELSQGGHTPGQFEFARVAEGTSVDAFIALGASSYLVCNHTEKTMHQIASDPLWTAAQGPFVDLSEKIAVDPLG